MKVKIVTSAFNPMDEITKFQSDKEYIKGKCGATNIFIGTMRDFNEGNNVTSMVLEHYPGMTEKQLDKIITEAMKKWNILDALVVHRVGEIHPEDTIVLVASWSIHRSDAFDSSRFIMEALKSKAPFWKKEKLSSNTEQWVEKNTIGYFSDN